MTREEKFWLCIFILASQAQSLQILYDKIEVNNNPYTWVESLIVISVFGIFYHFTGKKSG